MDTGTGTGTGMAEDVRGNGAGAGKSTLGLGARVEERSERTNLAVMQRASPMTHMRMVIAGISGSSMLDTEARTSGKGLSSSSTASRSNSILRGGAVSGQRGPCVAGRRHRHAALARRGGGT